MTRARHNLYLLQVKALAIIIAALVLLHESPNLFYIILSYKLSNHLFSYVTTNILVVVAFGLYFRFFQTLEYFQPIVFFLNFNVSLLRLFEVKQMIIDDDIVGELRLLNGFPDKSPLPIRNLIRMWKQFIKYGIDGSTPGNIEENSLLLFVHIF